GGEPGTGRARGRGRGRARGRGRGRGRGQTGTGWRRRLDLHLPRLLLRALRGEPSRDSPPAPRPFASRASRSGSSHPRNATPMRVVDFASGGSRKVEIGVIGSAGSTSAYDGRADVLTSCRWSSRCFS